MGSILLDTNVLSELMRPEPALVDLSFPRSSGLSFPRSSVGTHPMALQRPVVFKTTIVLAQMRPAVEEELHRIRAGKHGQPLDYCACQEMRLIRFQDDVSASAQGLALGRDAGASKTAFYRSHAPA